MLILALNFDTIRRSTFISRGFMSLVPLYRLLIVSIGMIAANYGLTFYTYVEISKLSH